MDYGPTAPIPAEGSAYQMGGDVPLTFYGAPSQDPWLCAPTSPCPPSHQRISPPPRVLALRHLTQREEVCLCRTHNTVIRTGRARLAELVEDGRLVDVSVESWDHPAFMHPDAFRPRAVDVATILSPFDPIVWSRDRAERLWNFEYRIEIYTPAARRVYGYYVMPVLVGDTIVGRLDLKTDRDARLLRVQGAFAEPGVDKGMVAERLHPVLRDMVEFVEVDDYTVAGRGDLAPALAVH